MAASCKDGAPGAGTHAQAEAMGLGPATVVRLERALAHEVLRYCTAMRGSVLKVVRGTRSDGAATGMQHGPQEACESGRQHRPPSRYGSRQGTVKLVRVAEAFAKRNQRKPPMVDQRDHPCQATRRPSRIFLRNKDMGCVSGPPSCDGRVRVGVEFSRLLAFYAQSVDNYVEGGPKIPMKSGQKARDQSKRSWGRADCD